MDIQKALNELYEEKMRLDWTISTLEARLKNVTTLSRSRRGRKNMGGNERLEVSKRMSAYWAGRRAAKRASQATSLESPGQPTLVEQPAVDMARLPSQVLAEDAQSSFPVIDQPDDGPESVSPPSIGSQTSLSSHLDDKRLSA